MAKPINHETTRPAQRFDIRGAVSAVGRTVKWKSETNPVPPDLVRPFAPQPSAAIGATTDQMNPRKRGNWNVSPLWEAKLLLGVLRERGLAGKGLVQAFERWLPAVGCSSRAEVSTYYQNQTGREMSDYILMQLADKVVRYNQLPPEAATIRRMLASPNLTSVRTAESSTRDGQARGVHHVEAQSLKPPVPAGVRLRAPRDPSSPGIDATRGSARHPDGNASMAKNLGQHVLDDRDPNLLLTTNEVARLTGFRPKTIRRWVSRNILNHIRVGNRLRFRRVAVELFLAQREVRK